MTVSDARREQIARRLAALSPEQRCLLEELRGPRPAPAAPSAIPVRPPAASYPLSFGQQRLWFLFRVSPESPAYNIPMVGWLEGELDPALLAGSLQVLAGRHEALRTRFVEEGGRPAQQIEPPEPLDLPLADLSALPPAAREAEAECLAAAEARRPFDLTQGRLLHRLLVRLGPREHRLLVTLPHIVTDGWSMTVFFRELPIVWLALRDGVIPDLPPLRIQAADHAVWLRERLTGPALDEILRWWTQHLTGAPAELDLPADRPRNRLRSGAGRLDKFTVPGPLLAEVRRTGAREGGTSFMTMLAAFAVLLYRYTAREDLVVGSPSAGRNHRDLENVMGFFVNTLALRLRPAADLPFRALLAEVRRTCLEAFARQEMPFEKLVDALGVERDPSRPPLVQVTFATQIAEEPPRPGLGGLTVCRFAETFTGTAKADLTLGVTESAEAGAGWIESSAELFDPATIDRLTGHWLRLLEGIVADPGCRVADLPLLGEAERRELLVAWNATGSPFPESLCIHELMADQAGRTPGAVAVEGEDGRLTYSELAGRARHLAHRLRRLGVGPEVVVAVAADRTPAMVVGLLAVLEAGGAYLPLDPSYPAERLRWMIEDSGAPLALTTEALEAALPEGLPSSCRALRIAEDGDEAGPLPRSGGPRHLAYVIYTSGSTGRPKGVAVEHRGLVNLVMGTARALGVEPGDRVLQLASTGFDAAVWETWTALALGARLVLPGREGALPGPGLARLLVEREITHAILPPSALALLPPGAPGEYPVLRVLCAGGEALPADLALRWVRGRRLVNAYGPTEITVCATVAPLAEDALERGERPPIGRPLPNVRVYVVEPVGAPAPVGVPGELWIGGVGLARGYLGRPDLTAARFIPDPFGGAPGERLYRTGDLVRLLPGGRLDFLGRIDAQVKVRGFRVEPGEIEAALRAHPGVIEAAVVPAEGDGRLVGFVVPAAADPTDPTDLLAAVRAGLAGRLPEFLRPAGLAVLETLPRTPAGKVDRRELARRAREVLRGRPLRAFEPPRDAVEAELAALWSELLGVERVGIGDDFFTLGGDSILALQLVARAGERGLHLVPRDLFENPTVAGLAAAARRERHPEPAPQPVDRPVEARVIRAEPAPEEAPRTATEEALARLWVEVLGVDLVGIHDDFFARGGDSILALQLVGRAQARGFPLTPRDLFENPTVAGLAAALPADAGASEDGAQRSEPAGEVVPLTALQAGMLYHSLVAPGSGVYVEQASCRLEGALDPSAFAEAWRRVLARHPALRVSFHLAGERPTQVVHPDVDLPWREEDWRGLAAASREERLRDFLREDARQGFDPERPPLLRLFLAREDARGRGAAWRVVWTWHHLLLDGWSVPLVLREVLALYGGAVLPPPAAAELAGAREPEDAAAAEAFWRETLAGFTEPTPLGALRGGPAPEGPAGPDDFAARDLDLSAEATERLAELARSCRVSLATVLAGVWALALARTAGRRDVVFGTVVAGRPPHLAGEAAPVGLWINSLPLRVRTGPAEILALWLRRLQALQGVMTAFQRTSLAGIQRWSGVSGPLFSSLFAFENYPADPASLEEAGLRVTELEILERTSYPLNVTVLPGERLRVHLSWDRRLLDPAALARLLGRMEALLGGLGQPGAAERPLAALPGLGAEERQAILREVDGEAVPLPAESVHELFAAMAARMPDAPAVVTEGEALAYGELDRRANRLARHLLALELRIEDRVAVALERSPAAVVALLAVWKAGGVWVPLDLSWPPARLGLLLDDSGATFLIAEEETWFEERLRRRRIVRLDREDAEIAARSAEPVRAAAEPDQLAYILFTSGSTGRPKGVMVPHRALANLARALARVPGYGIGPGDRVLQLAAPGFDVSLGETALALTHGAALHLARPEQLLGEALGRLLEERAITHLLVAPAALAAVPPRTLPALRVLDIGADVVPPELPRVWSTPGRSVFDGYGPTEATVTATLADLAETTGEEERLPIGRPLPNVRALVLDGDLDLAPLDVSGELCLGGAGLARGYLARPDLTAERFVPDPCAEAPCARLYRTGDRVRRRPDGNLDLLGRLDRQVQVRGVRVEPEEVEAALRTHPGVTEAAVVPAERGGRLVGFVVPAADPTDPTDRTDRSDLIASLRAFLRERLPDAMLPSSFVVLPEMPRTPSGKPDLRALELPGEGVRLDAGAPYAAPRNETEEVLARLWAEVLGVERVGIHDDFFALGGDSIVALQLLGRAQERGLHLVLRDLFKGPTVAGLAAAAELTSAGSAPGGAHELALTGETIFPLTPLQAGLLFHSLAAPGSGVYVEQASCRIEGSLDPGAFAAAWRGVLARHPALRLSFPLSGERPVQVVHPRVDLPWREEDWRGLSAAAREERLRTFLREDARQGFDLERAPLLRLFLAREEAEAWRAVWTWHHLLLDGWSVPLVLREVFALYAGAALPPPASGELSGVPEPEDAAAAEAFWRGTLAGFTEPTPLDALRCLRGGPFPDGAAEPEDMVARDLELPVAATAQLTELARGCRVSLAAVLAGAWALVLARTAGRRDVVFGTVMTARPPHLAGESAPVGLWLNSLPLRVRIEPAEPLAPWLRRLHELQGEMTGFQGTPLADVQRWSGVSGPLFASLFAFENYPTDPALLAEAGLRVTELETLDRTSYPLNVAAVPGERLLVRLSWDRRLFDPAALARLLGRMETLLAALGEPGAAERPLAALPGLADEERQMLLRQAEGPPAPLPAQSVHELVEAAAALVPEAPAVVGDEETLTYGELDRRANRLARHLLALGLRAEERVAVALERSPAAVVALLAVWKAGGVWVPLDLSWPQARLGALLDDSGATFLIAEEETWFEERLRRRRILRLDREDAEIAERSAAPVRAATGPDRLAYILFTSGSTGRPKGVMVPHRALANLVRALARVPGYGIGPGDRVLQLAAPGFDVSLGEIALALTHGAALHLASPDRLLGEALGRLLEERAITHLLVAPAALAAVPPRELPALRVVDIGADVVPPELPRVWSTPGRSVFDGYGPTEATVTATLADLAETTGETERLPIGRPLPNGRALVLDDDFDLAPLDVPGELCLGGAGLARGYLARPDLTAERFVPDPFATSPGERLYRTGDRVRLRPDGNLDLLGRLDRQVQVRGVRVEPEEVEAALRAHPGVAEAAVVPAESGGRLVGFVVPDRTDQSDLIASLRAFLRDRLPDAMLPSSFVVLPEMPRTPSGKPDLRALTPPDPGERTDLGAPWVAPRTEAEEALARIWAETLGVERVGIHDDFFALGGDSILSLQVIGRAAAAGLRLDPRMIFSHPTVAELAAVAPRIPRAVEAEEGTGPAPLTPIQRWFFAQDLTEPQHWNMPLLLTLPEGVDPARLGQAVAALVECHAALRARFPRDGRDRRQEIAPAGGPIPFAVVDLAALPEARRAAVISEGCATLQAGLDLENGPLFRAVLFAGPPRTSHRLFLLAHHLVVDGVSWRVILTDLASADARLRSGEPARLPAPPVSWRRWTERLAAAASSAEVLAELPLWKDVVHAGAPLPVDLPGAPEANTAGAAEQVTVELDPETTRALLQRAPEVHRAGIEEALLSALARALAPWLGEPVLFLDIEGHGRQGEAVVADGEEPLDLSRTVGWFTAVSPVRVDLRGAEGPGAALRRVKETLRGPLQRRPRKGLGYGLLRWFGSGETAACLTPAVPSGLLFNYLGQLDAAFGAGGIGLAPEPAGLDHAPGGRRSHLLEINAHVLGGRLAMTWSYGPAFHRRATIERLAGAFQEALRELAASPEETVLTPSDFPGAELDQASLDHLLARLG